MQGPIDDSRNTDNAWMHTSAYHFHDRDNLLRHLHPINNDTVSEIAWVVLHNHLVLFAEHMALIRRAIAVAQEDKLLTYQVQWFE